MKELQNFIYKHMDSLKQHKRYLAMLTALSLLVTFIVPLILIEPADSMAGVLVCTKTVHTHDAACYDEEGTLTCNKEEHSHTDECYASIARSNGTITDYNIEVPNAGSGEYNNSTNRYDEADGNIVDGVTYSPAKLPLYTLLFGDGADWVDPNKSLEENLEIVDDEYFLGFASDFCAFIESDFTAFDADAEGRMFVGGDLIFNGNPQVGEWNYQVGAGDYGHFIPISQTDEYRGISGFASGIIGGKVYRLGTITTGSTDTVSKGFTLPLPSGRPERHTKGYDIFLYPEEGAYKRFIVGNLAASLHLDEDYLTHGDGTSKDIPYSKSCNHLYYDSDCSICDGKNLDEITNEHSYLKNVNELSQFYQYTEVSTILEKTFDTIRARSLSLASVNATDVTSNGGTLTLDASNIGDAKTVYFKLDDWDGISNIEIKIPHDRIKKIENSIYTNNEATITELDLNVIVSCDDESITVNGAKTYFVDAQDGTRYDISNRNANATNNHPLSSNILYNFYNATSVEFSGDCNFNGTIMAPNANVTSPEKCPGHLSGALVAKSFYGGLEFGYRPYRGGVDIFGMTSGYAIPVKKFDENESVLPGALFAIKENGKFVSLFESGDGINFAALPSRVDFTGNTLYERDDVRYDTDQPKPYAGTAVDGKQLTAPVTIDLYTDPSCNEDKKIESGDTLDNVYTKLYLKANQDVNIDSNENYIVTGPVNGVYTIHLIKPAESLEITARNQGDSTCSASATVTFTPKMALNVTAQDSHPDGRPKFEKDKEIYLTTSDSPVGGAIYYKYFVNGNVIDFNNNSQDDDFIEALNCTYTPTAAGYYTFSVKAYVKLDLNGDGVDEYYEVAQAAASQITITEPGIPDDLAISIPDSITSVDPLTVTLTTNKELPKEAVVEYAFNNGDYQSSNVFSTQGVVGKDLVVKVRVTVREKSVELYDTITVNFNENDGLALNILGCYEEYGKLVYIVPSNDQISFSVNNIGYYSASNPTITYYFNNTNCNGNTVDKTVVGDGIPVYAIISANGLEKKLTGFSLTGRYHDQLGLAVDRDTCTVGDAMNLTVSNAPNGASVVFRAFDANGNVVWSSDGQTVNNGGCSVSFTPDKAGDYTFKAYMTFASNPVVELQGSAVTVNAMPVKGELSVTPNRVNVGNNVELKVYAATIGANVVFTLRDQYGNTVKTFNGTVGDNGECIVYYTPDQAGSFSVHTLITKDGSERQVQQSLNVNENTTTLTGEFTVTPTQLTPGGRAKVNVVNATNGAVVNVYITYADGSTQHQSGNINNGVYEYDFPTDDAGSYSVKVTLAQNGTTLDLGERKFTISNGNDVSGDISVSSNSVLPGENLNVNITNAPAGADVTFKFYYYGNLIDTRTGNTVNSDGNCSVQFAPAIVGNYQVEAVISTSDGNVKTIETSFKGAAQFTLDKDTYYGGEPCTITVDKVDSQTIGSVQKFTINGADVSPYTVDGKTITFNTLDGYYGDFELYLRIQLSGGAVTEFRTSITMVNSSASGQNAPFALRYVRIDAEDMDSASNQEPLVIEAPANESIRSVRLVFPSNIDASQAKFTISAAFNGNSNNPTLYSNTNVVNNEIVISGSDTDLTKIELTPVAGSITIDKCYPTYVKKENKITQKYAQDFTLEQYEEKEIVLGDWVKTLDSIVINLDETSNGNEGDVYYAFIHEGGTTASEFIKAEVSDNQIKITDINADDIEKIKIYTTKSSLTFKDYTISSFVGSDSYTPEEIEALKEALKTKTQDITSIYTLVEQQAPAGYFKENTVYIVEVKEAIDLGSFTINDAPTKVRTTVNVKTTDGITVLNYTVDITNTANGNVNTRTIEFIGEDGNVTATFTVTKNTDGNGNDTLTVASGDILDWDTTKPAQYGGYYFDPNAMMVVPVPAPIEYTNKIGLLFRKIDDKGATVKGVDISLVPDPGVVEDVDVWYWDEKSSEWLIDYTKLEEGVEYKFTETYGGGKYELAEDIHFCITADKEITYWTNEDKSDQKTINLNNERIIRMENTRVTGIKVKLKKTDMEGDAIGDDTNFARFSLHASDGTVLLDNIQVINGEVELDFGENNTAYVENGYLKPGTYYLKELSAPNGYEVSTKDFYFNVVKSSDGAFSVTSSEILPGITLTEETQDNGDVHRVTRVKADALQQISDGLTAETINASTPIIQFKFKTDAGQTGWGNAKFTAVINGEIKTPNNTKFPSGCNYHAASGGMSFQSTDVTVEFTVQQLCELFDISVENFNTINEFVISTWNKTDVEEIDFWVIENPINEETPTTPEETPTTPEETPTAPEIPMLSIDKNILGVSNKPLGTTMNLRVDKKWVGDEGATEFRKPVNVVLKQKTGKDGTYETFKPTGQAENYITLDSSNKWTYTWKDLPRYQNGPADEGDDVLYYYKVYEETSVTGYKSSVPDVNINEGGTIVITNTADTVDIPVTKYWNSNGISDVSKILPETLTVKLQAEFNINEWKDIPGKTLTLTVNNKQEGDTGETQTTWAGKFEKLPKGYNYRIVEVKVPFGWEVTSNEPQWISAEETNAATINEGFKLSNSYNIKTGSIALQKLWEIPEDEDAALPYEIYLNLYRSVVAPSYTKTNAPYTDNDPSGSLENGKPKYMTDYARLLQHSLYFYDANMCGTDVAENSALAWRTNCHVEDEVPGGYHDAGDHVMFGLPQGYTASMLGWSYLEFIKENEAGNNVNDNEKAHYKLILERFYDFFVDSVKYDSDGKISELLVQKGLGAVDHDIWCSPEVQVSRADEMVWTSTSGSNVAAEYAAALALGYINFNDGSDKYKEYLEVAEKLYEFAGRTSAFSASDTSGTYYSDGESDDDKAWAAAWLYEATGKQDDSPYKDARSNETGELQWDSVKLAAACAMARQTGDWSGVKTYIEGTYTNKDYFYIHSWGTARFNAMAQTATLIAAKHLRDQNDVTTANNFVDWAVGQMNKLLGDNDWKDTINGVCNGGTISDTNLPICLVTNFVPNGFDVDTPQAAHHRAASGWDTHEEYKANCGYDDDSYALIGALAGGPAFGAHTDQAQMNNFNHNHPTSGHTYIDDLHDYCCNEVAIDYNAGLVGAAAGLFYFKGTGLRSTEIEGVEYGAYGLTPPTATGPGIASPTKSAVSEAAQRVLLEEVANEYLYGMKRSRVSVLADTTTLLTDDNGTYFVMTGAGNCPSDLKSSYYIVGYKCVVNCLVPGHTLDIQGPGITSTRRTVNTFFEVADSKAEGYIQWNGTWGGTCTEWESANLYVYVRAIPNNGEDMTLTFNPSNTITLGDTVTLGVNNPPANLSGIKYYDHNNNEIQPNYQPPTAGEFTITAKAFANNDWNTPAATATGTLTVIDNSQGGDDPTVETMNFQNQTDTLYSGGTFTFTLQSTPNGTNRVEWNVSGNDNVSVSKNDNNGGVVTVSENANGGSVTITALAYDNSGNVIGRAEKTIYSINKMTINGTEQIKIGKNESLSLNNHPSSYNSIEWTLENNNAEASINGNSTQVTIFGKNESTADVIAKVKNNNVVIATARKSVRFVKPNITLNSADGSIEEGGELQLSINGDGLDSNAYSVEWTSSNNSVATVNNGKVTGVSGGSATITAKVKINNTNIEYNLTKDIQVTAQVVENSMVIIGVDRVGIQSDITLDKQNAPANATRFEWISSDTSKATVDQNGKVTGISAGGPITITLNAYDDSNTLLATDTKEITVVNVRTKEIVANKDINRTNGTNHCKVSLADIPSNAKITRITAYLSGDLSIEKGVHELLLKDGTVYQTAPAAYTLNGNGSMSVDTSSFKDNVLCGTEDSYYSFQIWWAGTDSYITVTNIVVEYETDGRELNLTTDKSTIRKGESVELTINAVGGEVAELTANPSGIIELPTTFANGVYEVTSIAAGEVTITAKVDDALTKSVKLVIKDDITINGNELMDLGGSQTLTVNNAIGNITWSVEGVEGTDGDIITLTNGATFNTKTGKVTAGSSGDEFTIIATDDYDEKQSSITISISERPKVPELPKDVFLEMVTRIGLNADNDWETTLGGLPLYDAKGNKYYYYIQESGYKQNSTSDYKPLTDQSGHFIYSKDASYMPSGYYNNGILPVENGTINIATVGNKFVSKQQGQLPSTGGSGVKTYYYFGGVMMLLGIAGFTGLKRRERKRRKG